MNQRFGPEVHGSNQTSEPNFGNPKQVENHIFK